MIRRFLLLSIILALVATACASTAVVTATSPGPTSSEAAAAALDTADSAELEPVELESPAPIATPDPAPAPDPTPAPSATPVPPVAPVPSATPEPTAIKPSDAESTDSSFDKLVADSLAKIETAAVVQVVLDRSIGPGEQNDYSSQAGIVTDRAAGLDRAVVVLSGAGWDGLASRNELARLRTDDRYEFVVGGDDVYMTAAPALEGLAPDTSWFQVRTVDFADQQQLKLDSVVITDPKQVVSDVQALLRLDIEPTELSSGVYLIDVPNAEILQLAPGSSILSLVALDQVTNQNPDIAAFTGTSPVQFFFEDGLVERVTVDLSPVFEELPAAGGTEAFEGIEISETYTVSFGSQSVLSLPSPDAVTNPIDTYPERQPTGECFTRDEGASDSEDAGMLVTVACSEPHQWEVLETGRYDDDFGAPYPDADALLKIAGPRCNTLVEEALDISLATTDLIVDLQTPTAAAWAAGDRQYACVGKFSELVQRPASEIDFTQFGGKVKRIDLVVGQCVRDEGLEQLHFAVVECAEPHFYEIYLRFAVDTATGAYPGEELVLDQAGKRCVSYVEARVTNDELSLDWQVQALIPSAETWAALSDRDVVCMATTGRLETGVEFAGVAEPSE